jgi:DNA-3-methyladenine glycosylase
MSSKIPLPFYLREDVVCIAKELLGKYIFTHIDNQLTGGIITETEAYAGIIDKASHAYNSRRTKRTEVMYQQGGIAYVYFCYGMHCMFNIVTNKTDIPHAILIRAIKPTEGINTMLYRTQKKVVAKDFSNGPGKVCKALGIECKNSGTDLRGNIIWLEDRKKIIPDAEIIIGKRIGVDYAKEDALLPYRFRISI